MQTPKSAKQNEKKNRSEESELPGAEETERFQQRLADRLKLLRKERSWTLENVAQRSGVSRAMLSQIESRKTNPTLTVLWKISGAFGLTFSALLGEEHSQTVALIRRNTMPVLTSSDGALQSRPLFPRGQARQAEFYELRLGLGGRAEGEPHPPGTRENLVVARGTLTILVSGMSYTLATGDAVEFIADVPHAYENHGREEALAYEVIQYR